VPPPDFVAAHARGRRPGTFLAGLRAFLGREETERLWPLAGGAAAALASVRVRDRVRLHSRGLLDRGYQLFRLKDRPKPLGANLAVWKADLLALNGFDERFVGWGYEDEDLARRLERRGAEIGFAPAAAWVLHLWHPPDPTFRGRAALSDNAGRFRRQDFLARCRKGIIERPLTDLRARVRSLPWLEARFPRSPAEGEPAELEVLGPGSGGFDPLSEVRLAVTREPCARGEFPLAHRVFRLAEGVEGESAAETVVSWLEERI
jgi:GT2 family glycosyltransferase